MSNQFKINLLPDKYKNQAYNYRLIVAIVVIVVLLITLAIYYQQQQKTVPFRSHTIVINSTAINETPTTTINTTLTSQDKQLWQALNKIRQQQIQSINLFNQVFDTSLNIQYKQLSLADNQLNLSANSSSASDLSHLITKLESNGWNHITIKNINYKNQTGIKAYESNIEATSNMESDADSDSNTIVSQLIAADKQLRSPINTSQLIHTLSNLIAMHKTKLINLSTSNSEPYEPSEYFISNTINLSLEATLSKLLSFIKGLLSSTNYFQLTHWSLSVTDKKALRFEATLQSLKFKKPIEIERLKTLFRLSNIDDSAVIWKPYLNITLPQKAFFIDPQITAQATDKNLLVNFIGTMQKDSQTIGLIEGDNGKIYTVTNGQYLPESETAQSGAIQLRRVVKTITENSMTIIETRQSPSGKWETLEQLIYLKTK